MQMSGRENTARYEDATGLCFTSARQECLSLTSAEQATKSCLVGLCQKETRRVSVLSAGRLMT